MDLQPPAGSKISVTTDGPDPTIVIPATTGAMRYFTGLFLLFWLGMWTIGFRDAGSKVISGNANSFLIFWLCGWTVGGILAAFTLYRAFRPSVPESQELKRGRDLRFRYSAVPVRIILAIQESKGRLESHLSKASSRRT